MATKKKETKEVEKIIGTVKGNLPLRIRKGKTTDSEVVGLLQPGDQVEIKKVGKIWLRIEAGYVMSEFIVM